MSMFDIAEDQPQAHTLDRVQPPAPSELPALKAEERQDSQREQQVHRRLMDCLQDEGDIQADERYQMAIDEEYNDHRHWRPEDAQVLLERGQAPLVFNHGRQTIEWLSGTEKRMRQDFKVLPREPGDERDAEVKQHLLKYTDDANMTQFHRSLAFKRMAVSGLWYLEEGINPDPEQEIIYSGNEDWRNVLRDSRARDIMMRDYRYMFRRKRLDLDYAIALLDNASKGRAKALLTQEAHSMLLHDDDFSSPWYLGQQLTNASEIGAPTMRASGFDERGAYMQSAGYFDIGRRRSVDVIECYYREPEAVQVFVGGPFDGRIYNPQDQRHAWIGRTGKSMLRDAVRMRMRIMLCTEHHCLIDVPTPFSHGRFPLIPLIAYRRARDGQIYGVWRGMRDLSDDTNKRRAKALWALSSNRLVVGEKDITEDQDLDMVREEAARPDGVLKEHAPNSIRALENTFDVAGNLQMAEMNLNAIRDMGGVTSENLGLNTNAQSGKAILAKQDQGSLTTSDLFDHAKIAIKLQGQIRLANIEQFWTQRKAIRIAGKGKPFDWVVVNDYDPETGEWKDDITQRQADFEIDTQDFRTNLRQAGLEAMFALLGQVATYAPQVVLSVLDLVVEAADLPQKAEWVTRIRSINGMRDPNSTPTPEEVQADADKQAKAAQQEALALALADAEVALKRATADEKNAGAALKAIQVAQARLAAMSEAVEIGIVATNAPHVMRAADAASEAAGLDLKGDAAAPVGMKTGPAMPPPEAEAPPLAAQAMPEQQMPVENPGAGATIPAVAALQ